MKIEFLKISQNSQKNICGGIFFNKDPGWGPATLLKRYSSTVFFFQVSFAKFLKILISETSVNDCL